MEINRLSPVPSSGQQIQAEPPVTVPVENAGNAAETAPQIQQTQQNEKEKQEQKTSIEELNQALDTANKTANAFDRSLRFKLHEKTKEYMISVVDTKTDKVIREIPPKEFLDMLAKMRDYIGMIFDKKA
ncbi:MAG: flagellar protein FlaG [Candidatus Riflebacteria bacterium]|nr:flagellar protein FlaG [Candidatus Riflebacteria bacterium]